MLSSYPVECPYESCTWSGNVVPSLLQGGASEEIASKQLAWFRCPRCKHDWEVRITDDTVTVVPVTEHGG
jgi:hypothetical protein